MWGRHYEQLLNDSSNETSKITVLNSFSNVLTHVGMQVTMKEFFYDCHLSMIYQTGNLLEFDSLNSDSL